MRNGPCPVPPCGDPLEEEPAEGWGARATWQRSVGIFLTRLNAALRDEAEAGAASDVDGAALLRFGALPKTEWPWKVLERLGVRPMAHRGTLVTELAEVTETGGPAG